MSDNELWEESVNDAKEQAERSLKCCLHIKLGISVSNRPTSSERLHGEGSDKDWACME